MFAVALLPIFVDGYFVPTGCPGAVSMSVSNVCSLMSDGNVYCDGVNNGDHRCWRGRKQEDLDNGILHVNFGTVQLQDGSVRDRKAFKIASSYQNEFTCAIVEGGDDGSTRNVTCFGLGAGHPIALGRGEYYGQCDDGNCNQAGCAPTQFNIDGDTNRPNIAYMPIKLPDRAVPESIHATGSSVCAVGTINGVEGVMDGTRKVYCWGHNGYCRLGLDTVGTGAHTGMVGQDISEFGNNLKAIEFPDGLSLLKLSLSWDGGCALFDDKSIRCWGDNRYKQRADGCRYNDYPSSTLSSPLGCGENWGSDNYALMSDIVPICKMNMKGETVGDSYFNSDLPSNYKVLDLYGGAYYYCALVGDNSAAEFGDLYCWGWNSHGQTGVPIANVKQDGRHNYPSKVNLNQKVKMAALGRGHVCAIMEDNTVQCWGNPSGHRLGIYLGQEFDYWAQYAITPGQPNTVNNVQVPDGVVTLGKCDDGCIACVCWESATNNNDNLVPASIFAGYQKMCVVFTDGSMNCWGQHILQYNSYGYPPTIVTPNANDIDAPIPCSSKATCASFAGCEHDSLKKNAEFCSGDKDSCDALTCCADRATCEGITNQFCESGGETFYTLSKGDDQECIGNSDTCDKETCCKAPLCGMENWGTDIPFATDAGISLVTDNLDNSELGIKFTLQTEPCVDRKNWLDVTYHATKEFVCDGVAGCASKTEQQCKQDNNCRFRIPCEQAEFAASSQVFSHQKTYENEQQTKFDITIHTDKLSTNAASAIYTQPSGAVDTASIKFCLRAAVKVETTEVLFRELALTLDIGMDGTFDSVEVESDSFQGDSVQDVDAGTLISANSFACTDANGDGTYEEDPGPTLTPNSIFTLCVVPDSESVECNRILNLVFQQNVEGESEPYKEIRIGAVAVKTLLTGVPSTKKVVDQSSTHIGCVVDARLGPEFFASTSPNPVSVSGSVLFDFKAASSRKLREKSSQSSMAMTVSRKRNLQGNSEPVARFDVQLKLSQDEVTNNKYEVDAGISVGGHCLITTLVVVALGLYGLPRC